MSNCGTCHGTGIWGVYLKPCPECGLVSSTPPKNRADAWEPPLRYKDLHTRRNRADRRRAMHDARRATSLKVR